MELELDHSHLQLDLLQTARPYQLRIVSQCCKYLPELGSALIESATGSGKTFMGLKIAEQMTLADPDLQVIWVAMNPGLLRQARKELAKFGITNLNFHTVSIMNDQQLLDVAAATQGKRKLLVCDEAQHAAATSMVHVYSILEPDYHLGLSATPFRQDKAQLGYRKIVKDASIHRLISDGWLSKFDLHIIPSWEPANVVDVFHSDPEKWGKSAFYFLRMADARFAFKRLQAYGHRVDLIDNDNNTTKQNIKIIEDFHAGNIDVVVNCMVLTEGFDCASLNTVFIRDGSKGPVTQMAGRVLRLHDDLPIKNIVQSQNAKYPFSRTTSPHKTHVLRDDKWVVSGNSEKAEIAMNETIKRMMSVNVELPKFLTDKANKRKKSRRNDS
jgi:superfamily II DNA or RNA helicase